VKNFYIISSPPSHLLYRRGERAPNFYVLLPSPFGRGAGGEESINKNVPAEINPARTH